jgi:RecB family exonuclease
LSLEDLVKIYRKEVEKCSLDEQTKDKLNSLAKFTLNRHLTKLNELTEPEALSEVDIKVNFEDIRLSGKLDAVIINREDQTAIIRDYKTGKSKERIEDKYKNQLYLYKLLLDLAPERLPKDIKLKGAELVYINASDDEVKTLSLDYNESEYEEFKKLIKQVWQEIMHLGQK